MALLDDAIKDNDIPAMREIVLRLDMRDEYVDYSTLEGLRGTVPAKEMAEFKTKISAALEILAEYPESFSGQIFEPFSKAEVDGKNKGSEGNFLIYDAKDILSDARKIGTSFSVDGCLAYEIEAHSGKDMSGKDLKHLYDLVEMPMRQMGQPIYDVYSFDKPRPPRSYDANLYFNSGEISFIPKQEREALSKAVEKVLTDNVITQEEAKSLRNSIIDAAEAAWIPPSKLPKPEKVLAELEK
jgi:hypothetical protein